MFYFYRQFNMFNSLKLQSNLNCKYINNTIYNIYYFSILNIFTIIFLRQKNYTMFIYNWQLRYISIMEY